MEAKILPAGETCLFVDFGEVIDLEKEIAHLTEQITVRTDYESKEYETLLHRLNDCNDRFQILGGLNREAEIEKTLLGLGFKRSDFTRATSEFSDQPSRHRKYRMARKLPQRV